jgi:hypothetical protein
VHAEERIIGLPSVASKLAQTVIVVDPTTGLPVAGTGGGPATIASGAVVSGAYATGAIVDLGAQADASWSGSGNGSLIAIMKAIAAGTAASSTLPIYGAVTTAVPSYSNATNQGISLDTTGAQRTTPISSATGGATPYHYLSAASNNATVISSGAHTVYSINIINTTNALYYLRIYDTASGPTCTSGTGVVQNIPIPNASSAGAGVAISYGATGFVVSTGLAFCLTGAYGDTDNTNAATGVAVNLTYK